MIISILVAMDERRAIGLNNGLPWRLSSDLKRFKELTLGHHIVLGRRTFESIGKPLPGRQIIVVTRNIDFMAGDSLVAASLERAVELAKERGETELFICGGARIYAESLALADRMYLTLVHAEVEADTFFPAWNESQWVEKGSSFHPADEKNQYPSTFKLLVRKPHPPLDSRKS